MYASHSQTVRPPSPVRPQRNWKTGASTIIGDASKKKTAGDGPRRLLVGPIFGGRGATRAKSSDSNSSLVISSAI
jgi:hypothetical protein